MFYYQFNIGDYTSHTARLSLMEDLAYRRMIDLYYLHERPLSECSDDVARDIGMREHLAEVEYVLSKFFQKTDQGYANKRIDKEIKAYKNKIRQAQEAGRASAEARARKALEREAKRKSNDRSTDSSTTVQPTNNHKPITNNKGKKSSRFTPPTLQEVVDYCDEKKIKINCETFIDFYESKNWYVGKNKMKSWQHAVNNWFRRQKEFASTQPQQPTQGAKAHRSFEEIEREEKRIKDEQARKLGFKSDGEYQKYLVEEQLERLKNK